MQSSVKLKNIEAGKWYKFKYANDFSLYKFPNDESATRVDSSKYSHVLVLDIEAKIFYGSGSTNNISFLFEDGSICWEKRAWCYHWFEEI